MDGQVFIDFIGLDDDLSWRDLAACTDFDPDLFFPPGDTGPAAAMVVEAKRICDSCVVKADCLIYAVETNQPNGVWGGTTEPERRIIRRRWLSARRRNDVDDMERALSNL